MMRLSEHFTYKKIIRFTLPSIIMMIFTSIYGIVDGFFVSNFAGKTAFAALNLIMPFLMICGCVGFMFGTGGAALVSKTLGEQEHDRANRIFTMIVTVSAVLGVIIAVAGFIFIRPIARLMGADGELLEYSVLYGRIILTALPFYILQCEFQSLCVAAEKPKLGLYVTIISGCTNMVLDWALTKPFGLAGAAAATAVSQFAGGIIPVMYFVLSKKSVLRFCRFGLDIKTLLKVCVNGSSEFLSNISASFISMLYNLQLMKYAGENGISAYGVLMYVSFVFQAIFFGYAVGITPVIGYHFGAKNKDKLRGLLKKSLVIVLSCSAVMFVLGETMAYPFTSLFVGYDETLLDITLHAFKIFSFSFLLSGFSVFGSAFFTSLNDGLTSAMISFLRTLVFQTAAIIVFPLIWEIDGIWFSIVAAEIMAAAVTLLFLLIKRKKYGY